MFHEFSDAACPMKKRPDRSPSMQSVVAGLAVLLAVLPAGALAAVKRSCLVSFYSNDTWSAERVSDVTFVSGRELSEMTTAFPFTFRQTYALIDYRNGAALLVRIDDTVLGVGASFTEDNFRAMFKFLDLVQATQITADGAGLRWRIKPGK
jgi:hypothetical protein